MKDDGKIKEYIAKKVNKVLKERGIDTMSGIVVFPNITFYWRPNNYRLQIPFNCKNFKEHYPPRTLTSYGIKVSNYGTKFSRKSDRITIMIDVPKAMNIGKMTLIYSLKRYNKKAWYEITGQNIKEINSKIDNNVDKIKDICIKEAKKFRKEFGGFLYLNDAKWIRHEDAIKNEDFIDSIPRDMIIHDTYFKKVYGDNIEFKKPAFVKKYISNRVTEEIAPELKKGISELKSDFNLLGVSLKLYNKQIEKHLSVLDNMDVTLMAIRRELKGTKKIPFWKRWLN